MKVIFWGVRGSIPVAGGDTVKYGGNSSCLEVRADGSDPLVLDCGSGARKLGFQLLSQPSRRMDLLFTHFHIDHVLGYPFFGPIFAPSFRIRISAPAASPQEIKDRLANFLNGVFHPLRVPDVPASIEYNALRAGESFDVGDYHVRVLQLEHPGGACGYRITRGERTFCYITDTSPFEGPNAGLMAGEPATARERALIENLRGAHVVVFDTMFSREAYLRFMTWGHSYPEYAMAICREAGVPLLYLFHHAPDATDTVLDGLARSLAHHTAPVVRIAMEGDVVDLEG